jgi:bifunctional non-homologous end joining protein LigD
VAFRAEIGRLSGNCGHDPGHRNRLRRFDRLLDRLAAGCVFDGEIVALDESGRPIFNDLLFGRREPTYIAFDLLFAEGEDVRAAPLKERKALLEKSSGVMG